jgi:hypothetical protein
MYEVGTATSGTITVKRSNGANLIASDAGVLTIQE